MSGGNWSVLDLTADPVRGEPAAARTLATASQQEAKRWDQPLQSLRTLASEGAAMEMDGDFAPVAREQLQAHPEKVAALARGRAAAGEAVAAYAGQLEQAKRESQAALSRGTQAKQSRDAVERNLRQVQSQLRQVQTQLRAMSGQTYYGAAYYAAVQRFNMLKAQEAQLLAQEAQCISAWERAEAQRMAARQQAVAAGERATQQERAAAEKVTAATPARATG
jgi:hypothetical protein